MACLHLGCVGNGGLISRRKRSSIVMWIAMVAAATAAISARRDTGSNAVSSPGRIERWRPGARAQASSTTDGQAVVVNQRRTAPLNAAPTISSAAPTAMKPTSTSTQVAVMISDRIPSTIEAIPTRISIPLAAAEPS